MATITRQIGPADQGLRMTLQEFIEADWQGGWLYELARGVLDVTEVPLPPHALTVNRVADLFALFNRAHPGIIYLRGGGGECRIRLEGMQSDRHPDQAIYLSPPPAGPSPWSRWVPAIVVEVVSKGGEDRDYVEKREEYLRFGITEYWILDPMLRRLLVLAPRRRCLGGAGHPGRQDDRTDLLPGLIVRPSELLGLATRRGR